MPIVTAAGFAPDDAPDWVAPGDAERGEALAVALPNDGDPAALAPAFARIALIAIPFPSFADGRGFSLARRLRDLGYRGRLRATGHLIPDQWRRARASGFDEVAIEAALLARTGEAAWRRAFAAPEPPFRRRAA